MVTNAKLFIPKDNTYDANDRGLFLSRNLLITNEQTVECYCRVQEAVVLNFQGAPNYTIVGYKIGYWLNKPETDDDYLAITPYRDPRNNQDTFYFTMQPQAMTVFDVENYAINDFVKTNRGTDPAKWPTLAQLYQQYNLVKGDYHMHGVTELGVNNVMHQAKYVSVSGKPLMVAAERLRYRGYKMKSAHEIKPLESYVYAENQFLYVDNVAFVDRGQIIADAARHFASEAGQQAVKELLKL